MIFENETTIMNRSFKWLEAGHKKPVLLLLHGFPDSARIWADWFPHFTNEFTVKAPLFPRDGDVKQDRFRLSALALDYMKFLDEDIQAGRDIHIVGHDIGAVLALRLTQLLGPQVVKSTVVINGLSLEQYTKRLKQPTQVLKSWYVGLMQVPGLAPYVFRKHHQRFQTVLKKFIPTKQDIGAETGSFPAYRAWLQDILRTDAKIPKGKIKSPLLVLWTAKDPFLNTPTWEEFSAIAEDVEIRMMEGTHWAHLENAPEVTKKVQQFFQGHV